MTARILIVDDEAGIRTSLRGLLEDEGYRVETAGSGTEALSLVVEFDPDLVLLDVYLDGIDGMETLARLKEGGFRHPVIMMSGQADLDLAVRATRLGAMTFLEKPLQPERVVVEAAAAVQMARLLRENASLREESGANLTMVGESPLMQRLRERIRKVAPTRATVLITGESGTGKELVARAVHAWSGCSDGPFVKVNCAAIPGELIESELFGHEKGSFTGAVGRHRGRFEQADSGSIFLDEVADTSLEVQARLLRVLQEGEIQRVGGEKVIQVDVRVIAATNRALEERIISGAFREDLFYRLNVLPLHVPPLRSRREDIPVLADEFGQQFARRNNRHPIELTPEALSVLSSYDWPGNVRELRNAVERLMILFEGELVDARRAREALPAGTESAGEEPGGGSTAGLREQVEAFEAGLLARELEAAGGVVSRVAERLQTDRANLYRKLKRYGLK
jgi:two-component system nitrogen regulation response regulator NtrX